MILTRLCACQASQYDYFQMTFTTNSRLELEAANYTTTTNWQPKNISVLIILYFKNILNTETIICYVRSKVLRCITSMIYHQEFRKTQQRLIGDGKSIVKGIGGLYL